MRKADFGLRKAVSVERKQFSECESASWGIPGIFYAGVILQTFPPLQTFPRKICNGTEKPLQTFPHCRSSPDTISTVIGFIFIYLYQLSQFYGKIPVIYITEYNCFIIKRQILHVQSIIMIFLNLYFHIYPKIRIRNFKFFFTKIARGRSAMLQIFPRVRSAMKGGRSGMLQTFALGGRSAMLQIFRGKVCNVADLPGGGGMQCCRPSGGRVCKGEGLQFNTVRPFGPEFFFHEIRAGTFFAMSSCPLPLKVKLLLPKCP